MADANAAVDRLGARRIRLVVAGLEVISIPLSALGRAKRPTFRAGIYLYEQRVKSPAIYAAEEGIGKGRQAAAERRPSPKNRNPFA